MTTHYVTTLGVAKFKMGDRIRYMGINAKTPHPEIFEVVGFDSMPGGGDGYKIKNKLGQTDFCYGDNYMKVDSATDDLTDSCTDITNHISPMTLVIEQNLQEQFQEANESEDGR